MDGEIRADNHFFTHKAEGSNGNASNAKLQQL